MPITPKPGHRYERRDGEIVPYDRPNTYGAIKHFPHIVGGFTYAKDGSFYGSGVTFSLDLVKDLGPTDPRLKKPRKKAAKKTRKVRMYFYRDGDGQLCASQWAATAGWRHNASWGRYFSQIVSEPVPQKKKA